MKTFDITLKKRGAKDPEMLLAVLYGHGIKESFPCMVNKKDFIKLAKINGRNIILNCKLEGEQDYPSLIKEIQKDVITLDPIHLDLIAVSLDEDITMKAKINLEGESIGVKNGGILQQSTFLVELKGRPIDLPDSIILDITSMDVGTIIKAGDLSLGKGVSLITSELDSILTIQEPKIEMVASATEEATPDAQTPGSGTPPVTGSPKK